MSISFDKEVAIAAVRRAAADADAGRHSRRWFTKVARFSRLCEPASKTHVAFLGTAILAKVLHADVDLPAIKPSRAPENPHAYSARSLCHTVLVPLAVDLGFSLGVTGREPLNNQPYFRMARLGDGTPLRTDARPAFEYLLQLVADLGDCSEKQARGALAAFVAERRRYLARYADLDPAGGIPPEQLLEAVRALVTSNSEGGRRAQAVVAGLMDTFAGPDRVDTGRVNDPSRRHPGDVRIHAAEPADPFLWDKAFEVRDKVVTPSDVQLFANECLAAGVREAAIVAVAGNQRALDRSQLAAWENELGIGVTVFVGWQEIVEQALFWAGEPKPQATGQCVRYIHDRLIQVEATEDAVSLWSRLSAAKSPRS